MTARERSPLAEAARHRGVRDQRLLDAIAVTPRAAFVPAEVADSADLDQPLPIPHEQTTTQPSLTAEMIAALELGGEDKALEVGTGYGYQTALMARLAGTVWSVERWPDLAEMARRNLSRRGIDNAHVVVGDGTEGLAGEAPFDAVLVSAAFPEVPAPLVDQLAAGGRLVQPIGHGGHEEVTLYRKVGADLRRERVLTGARFVRLVGSYGYPEEGS